MKRIILVLFCYLLISSYNCFSQIETKIKHVWGYSHDLSGVSMGITFGKIDTTYYVRCQIVLPSKEHRKLYLSPNSELTFISKSGNVVELPFRGSGSAKETANQVDERKIFFKHNDLSTVLTIPATREQLAEIGKEPFYKITLPYFENPTKSDQLIFTRPATLTGKNFTQEGIYYILGI